MSKRRSAVRLWYAAIQQAVELIVGWLRSQITSVVRPGDSQVFIHLVPDDDGHVLAEAMEMLPCTLDELKLCISTGRVVDFRAHQWLRAEPTVATVPLVYLTHFDSGRIRWPKTDTKKPNAVVNVLPVQQSPRNLYQKRILQVG